MKKKTLVGSYCEGVKKRYLPKKLICYMNCYILECTQLWGLFWVLVSKFAIHWFASIPWISLFLCTFETYIIILRFAIIRMLWRGCGTISSYFCWIFPLGVSNIVFSCLHGHFYNWFFSDWPMHHIICPYHICTFVYPRSIHTHYGHLSMVNLNDYQVPLTRIAVP